MNTLAKVAVKRIQRSYTVQYAADTPTASKEMECLTRCVRTTATTATPSSATSSPSTTTTARAKHQASQTSGKQKFYTVRTLLLLHVAFKGVAEVEYSHLARHDLGRVRLAHHVRLALARHHGHHGRAETLETEAPEEGVETLATEAPDEGHGGAEKGDCLQVK